MIMIYNSTLLKYTVKPVQVGSLYNIPNNLIKYVSIIITSLFSFQANKWCTRGIELLASQKIEKCSGSSELAEKSLHEIQQFIESASDFCLSSPRDFRNMFEDSTTVETKALVSQVRILKEEHNV
jgi:hypothetical protein